MSEPVPEIIHQQHGLTIKRNPKNKFVVATLYYFADPDKRSPEWEAEARTGMSEAQFRKEFLIDYTALFGEKAFPEIIVNKENIVIPKFEIRKDQDCWGGFDYGSKNPAAFVVFTIVDGVTVALWELYEPCQNIQVYAQKMRDCPYWDNIRYIAADPSIWFNNQQLREGNITSIYHYFTESGIYNFIKGNTDEAAWVAKVRQHWAAEPTFKIVESCPNLIDEFQSIVYSAPLVKQNTTIPRDALADYNNHALDATKYFMNSDPSTLQQKEFKWPIMVNKWKR